METWHAGYRCWCTIEIFVRGKGGVKGEWFPERIQGIGKSFSVRAGAGMESN